MCNSETYIYTHYLASKKSVDDRALNRHVWSRLVESLPGTGHGRLLGILELGAGIGTMIERVIDWGLISYAAYTAIDISAANIVESERRLSNWARERGLPMSRTKDGVGVVQTDKGGVSISVKNMNAYDFLLKEGNNDQWDLLIAHAFMDLVGVEDLLPLCCCALRPGGLMFLTLNYDGETLFLPALELDEQVIPLYHRSMDERMTDGRRAGHSKTGRYLFDHLGAAGARVLAAGSSDWIVHPVEKKYPDDEAYFLHFIVHTIEQELKQHPSLEPRRFRHWVKARHAQIEQGNLIYIAKQLDFLARVPGVS